MVGRKQTGQVQNNIGNGEDKELACTTHGLELRGWRNAMGRACARQRGRIGVNGTTIVA